MGLFDIFSGGPGRDAATWAANTAQNAYNTGLGFIGDYQQNASDALNSSLESALNHVYSGRNAALDVLPGFFNQAGDYLRQGYDAAQNVIPGAYNAAGQTIGQGLGNALGSLQQGITSGIGAINQGAATGRSDINAGLDRSLGMLQQGYGAGTQAINDASQYYKPYMEAGQTASGMLTNALGLGGQAGSDAALGAFQAGPGYNYQVEQARQAALRSGSQAGGMTGNVMDAILSKTSALANQGWGDWVKNLFGQQAAGETATQGYNTAQGNLASMLAQGGAAQAGLTSQAATNLSNIATHAGDVTGGALIGQGQTAGQWQNTASQQQADLIKQLGQAQSNLYTGEAANLSNLSQGLGTGISNLYTNAGNTAGQDYMTYGQQQANVYGTGMQSLMSLLNNTTQAQINAGNQGMMAGQQASATGLNALLGGLGTLGSLLKPTGSTGSGPSVLGSVATGLGGLFG